MPADEITTLGDTLKQCLYCEILKGACYKMDYTIVVMINSIESYMTFEHFQST